MPNARVAPQNWIDEMALDGSEASASMPVEFLQDVQRGHVWRSATISGTINVTGELNTGVRDANCFFVFRHNLAGGTYRLRLLNAADVDVYDSGTLTFDPTIAGTYDWGTYTLGTDPQEREAPIALYFASTEFKKFVLTIGGTLETGDTYAQACRIFLGHYLEVGTNPDYGLTLGVATNDDQDRTRGGSLLSRRGEYWRTLTGDLNSMSEEDRAVWLDIQARNGLHRDFVFSLFPEAADRSERDHTLNCKFSSLAPQGQQVSWRTMKLELVEC